MDERPVRVDCSNRIVEVVEEAGRPPGSEAEPDEPYPAMPGRIFAYLEPPRPRRSVRENTCDGRRCRRCGRRVPKAVLLRSPRLFPQV